MGSMQSLRSSTQKWVIYGTAANLVDCTPFELAENQLAEAKSEAKKAGINLKNLGMNCDNAENCWRINLVPDSETPSTERREGEFVFKTKYSLSRDNISVWDSDSVE